MLRPLLARLPPNSCVPRILYLLRRTGSISLHFITCHFRRGIPILASFLGRLGRRALCCSILPSGIEQFLQGSAGPTQIAGCGRVDSPLVRHPS